MGKPRRAIHRVKWRHSNNNDLYVVGSTVSCVKLSGEDLSRYSNKIQSVGLRKCPYYEYATKKVISQ